MSHLPPSSGDPVGEMSGAGRRGWGEEAGRRREEGGRGSLILQCMRGAWFDAFASASEQVSLAV